MNLDKHNAFQLLFLILNIPNFIWILVFSSVTDLIQNLHFM